MHRILFQIGDYPIYTYGVMMAIGILLGVAIAWWLARRAGKHQDEVIDFALWGVIAGIVGARLSYVIPRWEFYADSPLGLFAIWQGGLTIQGGLIGGLLAGIAYTWIKKINFWKFADIFAPGLVFGQAMGRIGCYFNGCSFGVPTDGGWGLVFPEGTDAFARFGSQPLYPTQLIELGMDLAIFGLVMFLWLRGKKRFDGYIFLAYAALWSVGTALIRFIRGDLAVNVSGLTGGQIIGFAVAAAALAVMFYLSRRSQAEPAVAPAKTKSQAKPSKPGTDGAGRSKAGGAGAGRGGSSRGRSSRDSAAKSR